MTALFNALAKARLIHVVYVADFNQGKDQLDDLKSSLQDITTWVNPLSKVYLLAHNCAEIFMTSNKLRRPMYAEGRVDDKNAVVGIV
jgi:hypothetical protein